MIAGPPMQLLQLQMSCGADGCTRAELTLTVECGAASFARKCVKWIATNPFEFLIVDGVFADAQQAS